MTLGELGYVLVGAPEPEEWRRFAVDVLGAMVVEGPDRSLYIKIDAYHARFIIVPAAENGLLSSAWLAGTRREFLAWRQRLQDAGVRVSSGTEAECRLRKVREFFFFSDPAGFRQEIFWGPVYDPKPFVSPTGVSKFVTGSLGMGHIVFMTGEKFDACADFLEDLLGFELSNSRSPIDSGKSGKFKTNWYHCANNRQHAFAIAAFPKIGCHHIMLQVGSMNDVGRALDRVEAGAGKLAVTLGCHVNDRMISFYVVTPGGFWIEYGYTEYEVDWSKEIEWDDGEVGSIWGHRWVQGI